MTDFNMPPGVRAADIPGQDDPRDDGGPAFPLMPPQDTAAGIAVGYPYPEPGMTLRDYFAAKAMQALVQARCYPTDHEVGTYAYIVADRMLKVRAR